MTQQKKKTAVINAFIDPETGFLTFGLSRTQGGSLYVPDGEKVAPAMGEIVSKSRDTIFILGQDYHPENHISFMTNHPGVMQYRIEKFKQLLIANNIFGVDNQEEFYQMAQQPVQFLNGMDCPPALFPFNEIVLDENRNIIGLKEEDGRIRKVRIDTTSGLPPTEKDRGRVTKVLDEYHHRSFDEYRADGRLLSTQTLWTTHCVQGKESSLYPKEMNLPAGLTEKVAGDLMSPVIYHYDKTTGNEFYVIRKGFNSEIDSYGIGVENDNKTLTHGWETFQEIAENLKRKGIDDVIVNVGGLATNFCVEFSANNIADFLAGHFKMRGMGVKINFVPEISRGIPIPGGADTPFSLDGVEERLKTSRNIGTTTVQEIIAMTAPQRQQQFNKYIRPTTIK